VFDMKVGTGALRAVVLAAALALIALVAPASADIYWSNQGGAGIGRAQNDGTGVSEALFPGVSAGVTALTVSGGYVYWGSSATTIGRAGVDGSNPKPDYISGTSGISGLVSDGTYLYWSNSSSGTIGRAPLGNPASANENFVTGIPTGTVGQVAVDSQYIYWADYLNNRIGRANVQNGLGVTLNFIPNGNPAAAVQDPIGVAVDSNYVYWTNGYYAGRTVGRANLNGSSPSGSFISPAGGDPRDLVVTGGYIYWSEGAGTGPAPNQNSIARAPLSGSNPNFDFITGPSSPWGLAVDTGAAPTEQAPPTFSGAAIPGQVLSVAHGTYTPAATAYTDSWEECDGSGNNCAAIPGASNTTTYTPTQAQVGSTLKVIETATGTYGMSAPVTSAPVTVGASGGGGGGGGGGNMTPPTVATLPASAIGQTTVTVNATVNPNGAAMTAYFEYGTSQTLFGALSTPVQVVPTGIGAVSISANLSGLKPGTTYYVRIEGVNTASGAAVGGQILSFTTTVPLKRISSSMIWTFPLYRHYATVTQLEVLRAPVGAKIGVVCKGQGCPRAATKTVTAPKCRRGTKCRPPSTVNVSIVGLFRGRRLAYGDTVRVDITQAGAIGKVYVFKIERSVNPTITCLAPWSTKPGVGC
jgi:hypothetical protein